MLSILLNIALVIAATVSGFIITDLSTRLKAAERTVKNIQQRLDKLSRI
jgi:uncharacterized membrane protein YciS (DUF1049 family)